jgi:hypothetical protein
MSDPFYDFMVTDRESFIKFLGLLIKDFQTNKTTWENDTLERFLETTESYAEDIQGYYDNTNQNINADVPSWKVFADILMGAKIYE